MDARSGLDLGRKEELEVATDMAQSSIDRGSNPSGEHASSTVSTAALMAAAESEDDTLVSTVREKIQSALAKQMARNDDIKMDDGVGMAESSTHVPHMHVTSDENEAVSTDDSPQHGSTRGVQQPGADRPASNYTFNSQEQIDRRATKRGVQQPGADRPASNSTFNPVSPTSDTDHTLQSGTSISPAGIEEKADQSTTTGSTKAAASLPATNKEGDRGTVNDQATVAEQGTKVDPLESHDHESVGKDAKVKVTSQESSTVPEPHPKTSTDIDIVPAPPHVVAAELPASIETKRSSSKSPPTSKKKSQKSPPKASSSSDSLRRGKWTPEEEAYVTRVIKDFNGGFLKAPTGTTLRSYLSDKLNCDPMRITKKFTGEACIGKRVFHPSVRTPSNAALIDKAQAELDDLETKWRKRLEIQQQESAKKAAASASAAAASGRLGDSQGRLALTEDQIKRNLVAKTASWLDRADAILSGTKVSPESQKTNPPNVEDIEVLPPSMLQSQIKEVEKLLNEGSLIQKTSKGLPRLLQGAPTLDFASNSVHSKKRSSLVVVGTSSFGAGHNKRPRRSLSANHLPSMSSSSGIANASLTTDIADAEGAQALVGLLGSAQSIGHQTSSSSSCVPMRRYSE